MVDLLGSGDFHSIQRIDQRFTGRSGTKYDPCGSIGDQCLDNRKANTIASASDHDVSVFQGPSLLDLLDFRGHFTMNFSTYSLPSASFLGS